MQSPFTKFDESSKQFGRWRATILSEINLYGYWLTELDTAKCSVYFIYCLGLLTNVPKKCYLTVPVPSEILITWSMVQTSYAINYFVLGV